MTNKILKNFALIVASLSIAGCIMVDIKGAGVFKEPARYDNRDIAHVEIQGNKEDFWHLGQCGGSVGAIGIIVPIPVPWYFPNTCEKKGFAIGRTYSLDSTTTYQLRYNSVTYDPYVDDSGSISFIKFKIPNFSSFKKAPDKTLIIHKRKPDGTIFTKELPFDWKIVVETSGGL